jgi:hypothetical protein
VDNKASKDMQKKKFDRIANDLKKERLVEREARRRALLDIKEDREKLKHRIHSQPTSMQSTNNKSDTSARNTKPKEIKPNDQFAFIQV